MRKKQQVQTTGTDNRGGTGKTGIPNPRDVGHPEKEQSSSGRPCSDSVFPIFSCYGRLAGSL